MKRFFVSVYKIVLGKLKGFYYAFANHCVKQKRKKYLERKRKRNKNTDISIIANNCVGGIIYSDLGLRFLSPTINLLFSSYDYFEFLNHLEYYLDCDLIQKQLPEFSYPIGVLQRGETEIVLHFMHYKTFEEAKQKWNERCKRVNFNNLYVIFEYSGDIDCNHAYYLKFKQLPFEKKRMLAYAPGIYDEEVVHCPFYHDNYHSGKILEYPTRSSKKRFLDHFDYVSFFN